MNNISEIVKLIKKKLDGTLDAHELAILEDWAKKDLSHSKLLRSVEEEEVVLNDVLLWLEMQEKDREITWRKKLEQQTFNPSCRRKVPNVKISSVIKIFDLNNPNEKDLF